MSYLFSYTKPPTKEITLLEFQNLAKKRIKIYDCLERDAKDIKDNIAKDFSEDEFFQSHFIMRIIYSKDEGLKNKFIRNEIKLFNSLIDERPNEKTINQLYNELSKDKLKLVDGVYKFNFRELMKFACSRKVKLKNGVIEVTADNLKEIVKEKFSTYMNSIMEPNYIEYLESDSNIDNTNIINSSNNLSSYSSFTNKYSNVRFDKEYQLNLSNLDNHANFHMPLCMKNLQLGLKKSNKLKNSGRLQYTLALKGSYVPYEECERIFAHYFTKVVSLEKFNKEYKYNIQHLFGRVGNKKNYSPYSCMKIIMGPSPKGDEVHGCPYRHANESELKNLLYPSIRRIEDKNTENKINEIIQLAKSNHYQVACFNHFKATHPDLNNGFEYSESVSQHPHTWYTHSITYEQLKNGKTIEELSNNIEQ